MEMDQKIRQNWKTTRDENNVVWVQLDREEATINTLSRDVLDQLSRILDEILREPPAGLVLCSGKENGFIAGADVNEFALIHTAEEAESYVMRVHALFERIETLRIPTVCLIHGFCLGGGLELALACRTRIAVDAPETQLGLPEVKLNIHPGFGGTARLIRQIGPLQALSMMLTGRSVDARRALKIGLVDSIVPRRQLMRAAQAAIRRPAARSKFHAFRYLLRRQPCRLLLSRYLRRRVAQHADRKHYEAPYALLDLWEKFGGNLSVLSREEVRSVSRLVIGESAQSLVRVFQLREWLQSLGRQGSYRARFVHVIGGGLMGGDIAAWCALQGLTVTIQDVDPKRLASVIERASGLFRRKLRDARLVEEALDRLIPDLHGDGIARADVVIEAIYEDIEAKRKLYQEIEPRMRQEALLATNTSSIPLEELSQSMLHPGRFVGLHFFNPVAKMPLVEVVQGKGLHAACFREAVAFVASIRRLPIPVTSSPGFLINRILMPYLLEGVLLYEEGVPAATIDGAARAFGMPMGPILLADTVGLDICLSVARNLSRHFNFEVPKKLESLVAAGRLGKKNGRGFYDYKKGRPVIPRRKKGASAGEDLMDRMVLRLLNEAIACLRDHIVSDEDLLDAGAVFGIGFAPFRGGPMHYIRKQGASFVQAKLRILEQRYGERFAPDPGWYVFVDQTSETGRSR